LEFVFELIQAWSAQGSDPGVCVVNADDVSGAVVEWGNRALTTVLEMKDAVALAADNHLNLRALGGTGQGIIGALASVGLRAGGETGRFVDMPGLRTLPEVVEATRLRDMGIEIDYNTAHSTTQTVSTIKTLDWIRPRLSRGKPVLTVNWSDHDNAWVPVDRKKVHVMEQS
jgi:tRNA(Ile2) C34 agmatinyltransferase TiaS